MRKRITISINGVTGIERAELIDCMSKCLAAGKKPTFVQQEGYTNEQALDLIPATVQVIIIAAEKQISMDSTPVLDQLGNKMVIVDSGAENANSM